MLTISPLDPGANFIWQIRVSCKGKFIKHSGAIRFSTLSATRSMRIGESSIAGITPGVLMVNPNPSRGQFMLQLRLDSPINATATIRVVDAGGQLVQAENAAVANGYLQKMISMKTTTSPGLYMVNTLVNGKVYTSKLLMEK
jgi:hypothetical protein